MFGAVLAALSVLAGPARADTLTYENARFGTTVTFPAHIFREVMEPPPRGGGMTFLSADGASMAVFAMNNARGERLPPWFAKLNRRGALVLIGDPGRSYLPKSGPAERAVYSVPATRVLEDAEVKRTTVWEWERT